MRPNDSKTVYNAIQQSTKDTPAQKKAAIILGAALGVVPALISLWILIAVVRALLA